MLSININFKNFIKIKKNTRVKKVFESFIKDSKNLDSNQILLSLTKKYEYSFDIKKIKNLKKFEIFRIFGMGGSILGAEAIYNFLKKKVRKKFLFIDNINNKKIYNSKKKIFNLIISKSGNTLETISNFNSHKINKDCLFITEKKQNYLNLLANKLKSEVVEHNNFIGGRYSVLSETGMIPAYLMGLKPNKFKKFENLIRSKKFISCIVENVSSILFFHNQKKNNSIILNYDEQANSLFKWYQQLVAESLGKSSKGILPIISNLPKDNHSVMQHYLDGVKNNFYTFFYVKEKNIRKIEKKLILKSHKFLKDKDLSEIMYAQFLATKKIFLKKKLPFRCFVIKERNEETLGELFTFFILETILLGKVLKINPYNQPAVEQIKRETYKILKT